MVKKIEARDVLIYMVCKYNSDYKQIIQAIKDKEKMDFDLLNSYFSNIKSKVVTIVDKDYPKCLKIINNPPLALFYYGDLSILSKYKKVGIVGSRINSKYGELVTKGIVDALKDKKSEVAIISGMAKGIDSIAQNQAILNNMKVVSFLGCGIETIYPKSSNNIYEYCKTSSGLVCSEYCMDIPPLSENFPLRNRLISASVDILCIPEGKTKSGTSITSNYAIEYGKSILCVPNNIDSQYDLNNKLIQEGAYSYLCTDDLFYLLERVIKA